MSLFICLFMYIYIYTYIYIYIHTYIHTYMYMERQREEDTCLGSLEMFLRFCGHYRD